MANHDELIAEMPKLERMSNAARLKLAKKRRLKQLKRNQEITRRERETGQYVSKSKSSTRINFISDALLHEAVCRNDLSEVENLLKQGVNPNPSNADGLTPLHRCCIENTVDMAKLLLEYSAERDARDVEGWTPLHAASACGNLVMINLLIDNGASMVTLNHDDKMPVDVACDGDIRYVIQQKMLEEGYTDDVCKFIRSSIPNTMLADIKDSIKSDRSINIQDKYGATALHVAAANGYTEVLTFLLQQPSIKVDIQDNEGWTPFHAAVCWEQKETMALLAKNGANLEMEDIHGDTPYAVSDNPEIRQYIIELKSEFTMPMHESLSVPKVEQLRLSMEDLTASDESRGRKRSMSARRSSIQLREGMKRESAQSEKKIMEKSLDNDDMERSISGKITSDPAMPLSPMKKKGDVDSVSSLTLEETNLNEDGTLADIEKNLDEGGPNKDRRRKLKSVLKSNRPTPVITDTGVVNNNSASAPLTDIPYHRDNGSPTRPRECCSIM